MGRFVTFRRFLSRQPLLPTIHLVALLVSIWLADLQCSDCIVGSDHRASATALGPLFNRELDWMQYRDNFPQVGGPLVSERHLALVPTARVGPTRDLKLRRRARGVRSIKTSADSNSKRAPPEIEVEALIAFKAAITSDPSKALRSWVLGAAAVNDSDTCRGWVGVTCSSKFPNNVVGLSLPNLQLGGHLDSALQALGHLPFLQSLDFSNNVFKGSIKGESLTNFSHLSSFNVSSNGVDGDIPFEIGELVSLETLNLSNNSMTGLIPDSLANCSLLKSIEVGANMLVGDIPPWVGTLSRLEILNVSTNSLSGSIPVAIGNCSSLRLLDLQENFRMGGALPAAMSLLKQLQIFAMWDNVFSGAFPLWIGNLTSLSYFSLFGGFVQGQIPDSIGQLQFLSRFTVGDNNMTGVLPLSICNLTALVELQVGETNIGGHIPPQIGLLPNLEYLNLGNQFTGLIPSSLANCSTLLWLELGDNEMMDSQPLPVWLGSLTSLTIIYLSAMNLYGELDKSSIENLFNLQILSAANNNLSGTIPIALQNCSFLRKVDLSSNNLTGSIPQELGVLRYMSSFKVPFNSLAGSFPDCIANWTQLVTLSIESNAFSGNLNDQMNTDQLLLFYDFYAANNWFEGPVPETLTNCTTINIIQFDGNFLSGPIPASLGNLTNLQSLSLAYNNLDGTIPVEIFKATLELVVLSFGGNYLEGAIPSEIGQLGQLRELYLDQNNLTGIIPNSLGNCSGMNTLNLGDNQLEGSIPGNAISQLSALLVLNLSHNLFSGAWPTEFEHLTSIQYINVSYNNISGSISPGLGLCVNLITLDISMNGLTGEIPQDLGSLVHLDFFNASFNSFTGPVPQSGIFNSSQINESSFLGNPGLCGPTALLGLDHQECGKIPQNVSINNQHCNGFDCTKVWIPVAIVSTLIVLVAIFIIVWIRSTKMFSRGRSNDNFKTRVILDFGSNLRFSERELLQTIDDPRGDNIIGVGARSIVYRGVSHGGRTFAIKMLLPNNDVASIDSSSKYALVHSELAKEAQMLAKLRHKNILKCLSFYSSVDLTALILEYMSGGSLHKHLHEVEPCELTWQRRLKIAVGVAEGLKYLHHDFPEPIIHRDLKPGNIFLDEEFEPKVGDFGISKFGGLQRDGEATASSFCGTIGYMPPEYASQTWVSTKGDVYSYGMVLIELLTQRHPCSSNVSEDQSYDLRSWVLDQFHQRHLELLTPSLVEECNLDEVCKERMMLLLRVGLFCTREEPQSRPSMINVVGMLTDIINLGVEPINWRTIEDLAHDGTMGVSENPAIEGAELGSNC